MLNSELVDIFWARVHRVPANDNGCWIWPGPFDKDGYGLWASPNRFGRPYSRRAHRFSFEAATGSGAGSLLVCHRCDTPACVNPAHLFLGTYKDNFHDCLNKGRYTPKGVGNAAAKMTEDDIRDIRAVWALGGISQQDIATAYELNQTTISNIVHGRTWRHVS